MEKKRYEVNTQKNAWGDPMYNIWDSLEMEEIPIREGVGWNTRDYTTSLPYAEEICSRMNERYNNSH